MSRGTVAAARCGRLFSWPGYYIETDTWTDEEGNTYTDSYRVYYDYYICTVTLENFNLSHLPIYIMGEDQLSRYALYMATLGNRPDLFPSSP